MLPSSPRLLEELTPHGILRAAINLGNPVIAQRDAASGEPAGVSVDLARELGTRLGVEIRLIVYDGAGKVVDAAAQDAWDVAFLAIDPGRATRILYTAPYVLIEGTYMVPAASRFHTPEELDRPGVRIAVGRGAAYDLFLSRALKAATITRCDTSRAALDFFRQNGLEAAAGVRQTLEAYAAEHADLSVLDGHFTAIRQAVAVPAGREDTRRYVHRFVDEMKTSGFIHRALQKSGQRATEVPPDGQD